MSGGQKQGCLRKGPEDLVGRRPLGWRALPYEQLPARLHAPGKAAGHCGIRLLPRDEVIPLHKPEGVSIQIVKTGENSTPRPSLRRMVKANPARPPLVKLGYNVFGNQHGVPAPANQLVFWGIALGSNQREKRIAIGRSDQHQASTGFVILRINDQGKSELVHIEPQTPVLIADENIHTENPEAGVLPLWAKSVRV